MTCAHCCFACTGKGTFMNSTVFHRVLEHAVSMGDMVTIGGGEPTLHPKCIEWVIKAAVATVDISLDNDGPAVLIVTNGKKTDTAIKLAKLAHLGMIAAEVSQDPWHNAIDTRVIGEFTRYSHSDSWDRSRKGYAGIRDVSRGVVAVGRAKENDIMHRSGCACETLFIAPNGDYYQCGCKKTKLGNILTSTPVLNESEGTCENEV